MREFGRSRLRGSRGYLSSATVRPDGRQVKPLPSRAQAQSEVVKDWKKMFRISCNWRTGLLSNSYGYDRFVILNHLKGRSSSEEEITWEDSEDPDLPVHVALAGGLIITASPLPSPSPQILLHTADHPVHSFSASSIPSNPFNSITAIALDQSQPTGPEYRLAVFYSIGDFCLFLTSPSNPKESIETLSYVPTTTRHRTSSIVQAAYHHPLLITFSTSFDLTIYELPSHKPGGLSHQIRVTQSLTSFSSHPPTSLVLSNPSPQSYRLVLAYSVPVYPSHWTVAITELAISSFTVQSTQSTGAFDLNPGWSPLTPELLETLSEQYALKLSEVSSTCTDGRYVVLAGAATNSIQLYRLSSRSRPAGPKLTFVRTLNGHTSPVQALSIADGRCVSLSRDGSLWVWDLERGGVEVKSDTLNPLPGSARVLFDERQILVVLNGRIVVKRFDV